MEVQCAVDKHDETSQTADDDDNNTDVSHVDESLKSEIELLKSDINDLNFQLSTMMIQRTSSENVSLTANGLMKS